MRIVLANQQAQIELHRKVPKQISIDNKTKNCRKNAHLKAAQVKSNQVNAPFRACSG